MRYPHTTDEAWQTIEVWSISKDGRQGERILQIEKQQAWHWGFKWHPNGHWIGIEGKVFDMPSGNLVFTHLFAHMTYDTSDKKYVYGKRLEVAYTSLYWSPDGSQFAALLYSLRSSASTFYGIFDTASDQLIVELVDSRTDPGTPVFVWSKDGKRLTDGVRTWDTQTGELLNWFESQDIFYLNSTPLGEINAVWSIDNQHVISLYSQETFPTIPRSYLYYWDAVTGEMAYRRTFSQRLTKLVWQDGNLNATSERNYSLTINPENGDVISATAVENIITPTAIIWSPNSQQIVLAGNGPANYPLELWDISNGKPTNPVWSVNNDWYEYEENAIHYRPGPAKLIWDAESNTILTVSQHFWIGRNFSVIERWNPTNGLSLGRLYWQTSEGYDLTPMAEPSPNLRYLAEYSPLLDTANQVNILDISTQDVLMTLHVEDGEMGMVAWSPDSSMLATLDPFGHDPVYIWNISQNPSQKITTSDTGGYYLEWSPSGEKLLVAHFGAIRVLDSITGNKIADSAIAEKNNPIYAVWHPDSKIVAFASTHTLYLWDVENNRILSETRLEDRLVALAWSPDGSRLGIVHENGMVSIWEVRF
ncbi:MAG: hypothetical protein DPW16_00265 [Chloroflexi bacterium]|nr:hypothetical protein [Chloroflexota bacterium]